MSMTLIPEQAVWDALAEQSLTARPLWAETVSEAAVVAYYEQAWRADDNRAYVRSLFAERFPVTAVAIDLLLAVARPGGGTGR